MMAIEAMEAFKRSLLDDSKKINDCCSALLSQEAARYGLTALQLRLLMELYLSGAETVGALASSLGQAGTNVSTLCKKLEKSGLLDRHRSESDERVVQVRLTQRGREMLSGINTAFDKKLHRLVAGVDPQDLEIMLKGLKMFAELLSSRGDLCDLPSARQESESQTASLDQKMTKLNPTHKGE